MDKAHFDEMERNYMALRQSHMFDGKGIFLFGHCNATEELAGLFLRDGFSVSAILDNNEAKQGEVYHGIPIEPPEAVLDRKEAVVCIAARFYASMKQQLRSLGYEGPVYRMVEYDSFSEFSLDKDTRLVMDARLERGLEAAGRLREKYPGYYRLYCPFSALGDVVLMMSYLPYHLERREISGFVVCVVGNGCVEVARMYGAKHIERLSQKEMDEQIQAILYEQDGNAFIPHHDRPYVQDLYKILYLKCIPLEKMYQCGVYALPEGTEAFRPLSLEPYPLLWEIPEGRAVVLSPYAKSVTHIGDGCWERLAVFFRERGFAVYTNIAKNEEPLVGTLRLQVPLPQLQSVVERAGIFIGLRSGLCDVLKWADCKKIALYPDVFYSDTKWKVEEIYHIDGWENLVIEPETDFVQEIESRLFGK